MWGVKVVKKVHILGSGGREHAIGWAFKRCGFDVHYYPGNAGTLRDGTNHPFEGPNTISGICDEGIVIPGAEKYLVDGIGNLCRNVFGPVREVARLEGSKVYAKRFMKKYSIPTGRFEVAETPEELVHKLRDFAAPYVIKADGLASGKGVIIERDFSKAVEKGSMLIEGKLLRGVKGPVVIDEFLAGEELTAIAIVNGEDFSILPFVRDYKRLGDNDMGPNTGGMGAWGPVMIQEETMMRIEELFRRTLWAVKKEGGNYRGFLYLGLMIVEGSPYVLEYNVRLGDPETEVIVALNPEGFVESVLKAVNGEKITSMKPQLFAVDVVIASKGYPEAPMKGQKVAVPEEGFYFFAGVEKRNGEMVVSGGRVVHAMGTGYTKEEAKEKAYLWADAVEFDGKYYRSDIAK